MTPRQKELICEPVHVADWLLTAPEFYERHIESIEDFSYMPLDQATRAAACVNACRSIVKPEEVLAQLHEILEISFPVPLPAVDRTADVECVIPAAYVEGFFDALRAFNGIDCSKTG